MVTFTLLASAWSTSVNVGRTTTVTVRCAPLAMLPRLQITRLLLLAPVRLFAAGFVPQVPCTEVAETNVRFGGSVSVIVTAPALDKPFDIFRAAIT